MCILYIYVCLLLDLMKGGPLKIHFKYLYLFICCPPNPVLLLEVFVHSEHQGGLISSPKKHLSPSWTFPMHLQLQSLRLPNSNCCMLSSCDSQPNNFSILRVDFFGGSGKHRGKSKDNFLGGADWFSFKNTRERYLSVKPLVYTSSSTEKKHLNEPSDPPFFLVGTILIDSRL